MAFDINNLVKLINKEMKDLNTRFLEVIFNISDPCIYKYNITENGIEFIEKKCTKNKMLDKYAERIDVLDDILHILQVYEFLYIKHC